MYCMNCGAKCPDTEQLCTDCKKKLNLNHTQNNSQTTKVNITPPHASAKNTDSPSWIYALLGFFFPWVGLILYCVWRIQTPRRAKSAGKGALFGAISLIILYVVTFVLYLAPSMTSLKNNVPGTTEQTQQKLQTEQQ